MSYTLKVNPVRCLPSDEIKVECCGFPVAKDKYYHHFWVVELQKTFYQPPDLATVQKWQLITHPPTSPTYRRLCLSIPEKVKKNYGYFKPTEEILTAWAKIDEICQNLGTKVIVFQCPASFTPTQEHKRNLRKFFRSIERRDYIFCWEPRGKWNDYEIESLCKELGLVHCVDPFKSKPTYGKIKYFRLHGIGGYRYRYTNEDLKNLKTKQLKRTQVYYMFNNMYMFEDAVRFQKIIVIG